MPRHLLVAMDGPAAEAVRGLKAEKDSDLNQIWDALHRRFGFVDEPERAMRRFDARKQQDGESLAVFEQNLRILHREAWPKTDLKSPEADSLLRRKFVDGIADRELQKYICVCMPLRTILQLLCQKLDTLLTLVNCQGQPRNPQSRQPHLVSTIRLS